MKLVAANGTGPSESAARYLEALFYMEAEGESVRSVRLAEWLGVSRPTVAVALRRMSRDGLVRMGTGKEVQLTAAGRREASAIVRRHRIMERWLVDVLGFDWVTADEEAARLEHAVSDRLEKRLYQQLGRPQTCPHGNPIPGYADPDRRQRPMTAIRAAGRATVCRVSEVAEREAPALLTYLMQRRLVPGAQVQVLEVDDVGQTMTVKVGGRRVTLGRGTAGKVWVIPASKATV